MHPGPLRSRSEHGQATVALVAVIPAFVLVVLAAVSLAFAGHAAYSASHAARAAARASYVGEDTGAAARGALPPALRDASRVRVGEDGTVRVEVEAPTALGLLPAIPVSASALIGPEDGVDG